MTSTTRTAEAIDEHFVAALAPDLAVTEIDGEIVYALQLDETYFNNFDAHWLDASASTIWRGLDGERTVGELASLIAAAFELDPVETLGTTTEMVRSFARAGAIVGVEAERPEPMLPARPEALERGTTLPAFETVDLDGNVVASSDIWGAPTLFVHWSPTCTYCRTIAVDLVDLAPALADAGVGVVMFTLDTGDQSAALLAEVGLEVRVLRNPGYGPFAELGTPSGYLVDGDGRVDSELAVGSTELVDIARHAIDVAR